MKIKVCGLHELKNIRSIDSLDVDYVGFIFYEKSKRNVLKYLKSGDLKFLKSNAKKVGVFVNKSAKEIQSYVEDFGLDLVQLHGDETPETCKQLKEKGIKVIKVFPIAENFNFQLLAPYKPFVDYFLFDTKGEKRGGNGTAFDWSILKAYPYDIPFFLAGGIGPDNLDDLNILNDLPLHCIDLNSKVEIIPGLKNPGLVQQLVDKVKSLNSN